MLDSNTACARGFGALHQHNGGCHPKEERTTCSKVWGSDDGKVGNLRKQVWYEPSRTEQYRLPPLLVEAKARLAGPATIKKSFAAKWWPQLHDPSKPSKGAASSPKSYCRASTHLVAPNLVLKTFVSNSYMDVSNNQGPECRPQPAGLIL